MNKTIILSDTHFPHPSVEKYSLTCDKTFIELGDISINSPFYHEAIHQALTIPPRPKPTADGLGRIFV